jgi:hypothetical protein
MYEPRLVCNVGDWSRSVRTNTSVREGKTITERVRDDAVRVRVSRELGRLAINEHLSRK